MGVHSIAAGSHAEAFGVWPSTQTTSACASICCNSSEDGYTVRLLPWANLDTFVQQLGSSNESGCMANHSDAGVSISVPRRPLDTSHRRKFQRQEIAINYIPDNLCVARFCGQGYVTGGQGCRCLWLFARSFYCSCGLGAIASTSRFDR